MIFSNLMTFGDADNDLEMIEAAAQGIVMETDFLTLKQWQLEQLQIQMIMTGLQSSIVNVILQHFL